MLKAFQWILKRIIRRAKSNVRFGVLMANIRRMIPVGSNDYHESVRDIVAEAWSHAEDHIDLTPQQRRSLLDCKELQDTVIRWAIQDNPDLEQLAVDVDYSRWQITGDIGTKLNTFLPLIARELLAVKRKRLSVAEHTSLSASRNISTRVQDLHRDFES